MNLYTITVVLAGDRNHVVTNKGPVTVAEIAVLKAIHGADSVQDIRLYKHDPDRDPIEVPTMTELRDQLRLRYQNALPAGNDAIVDKLFGPMGALPTTLADIGIDAKSEAQRLRAQAEATIAAADQLEAQDDGLTADAQAAELQEFLAADEPPPRRKQA